MLTRPTLHIMVRKKACIKAPGIYLKKVTGFGQKSGQNVMADVSLKLFINIKLCHCTVYC